MPEIYIPDVALKNNLDNMVENYATVTVDLFKNDYTPVAGTVVADFTVADYAAYVQATATFLSATLPVTRQASSLSTSISFPPSSSGTQVAYGWFALDAGGRLIDCRRFDAPITISTTQGVSSFKIEELLQPIT